jgi:4-hydroxybenzoate polyprenyltransferase
MPAPQFAQQLSAFAADIKISHTIFAMPWAVLATVMAWQRTGGAIWFKLVLIVICMIAARTFAMASNRLLDAKLDARNPRTQGRAIPSGRLSAAFFRWSMGLATALFFVAAIQFYWFFNNIWPLVLSAPVLLFIGSYPLLKRFTPLCHFYLGAALAMAPICAWLAVSGGLALPPILMAGAVLLWTAGFDVIYACQDYESDRETGVMSLPVRCGIGGALWISRLTHLACLALLVALGLTTPELSTLYFIGVACAAALLVIEHSIVKPHDLSKVGLAFFTVNGVISVVIGTLGIIDTFI